MSASASKRMPTSVIRRWTVTLVRPAACQHGWTNGTMTDIQAVTATLVRPAAYQHGWTNGNMTDIQAVTASSVRPCIVSLRMWTKAVLSTGTEPLLFR